MRPGRLGPGMTELRAGIDVDAPIEACFEAWRDFENFPEFMAHIRDVRMVSDRESVWTARVLGVRREWRAQTTDVEEHRRIAWQAQGDVGMDGDVLFTRLGPERTRIDVRLTWHGEGAPESIADTLGIDQAAVERDLRNFKGFVEASKPGLQRSVRQTV
jgi:uncharacterized membrane protein